MACWLRYRWAVLAFAHAAAPVFVVLDGVYEAGDGSMRFLSLPPPGRHELERILRRIARQVEWLMERRAMEPTVELLAEDQPLLAGLAAASSRSQIATGHRSGQEVLRRGDLIDADEMREEPLYNRIAAQRGAVADLPPQISGGGASEVAADRSTAGVHRRGHTAGVRS